MVLRCVLSQITWCLPPRDDKLSTKKLELIKKRIARWGRVAGLATRIARRPRPCSEPLKSLPSGIVVHWCQAAQTGALKRPLRAHAAGES